MGRGAARVNQKKQSPTITDPFLQSALASKQPKVQTVYSLPDTAEDGTVLVLYHEGDYYECTRTEGKWMYKPLYNSIKSIR